MKFDVIIFGATGFAGKLVSAYIADHYKTGLRWAIAGRNEQKLKAVRDALVKSHRGLELDIVVADSADRSSLDAMCAQTKVVCTTVGPYAKYGEELVASCIANGTHYCDLTGENQFIRRMIDQHHAAAADAKVRIVNCCGFDSIPSDLGTFFLQAHELETHGTPCPQVDLLVWAAKGGFSGGTIASVINIFEEVARDPSVRKILGHPYGLNPEGERKGPDGSDSMGVGKDVDAGWTAPFLMAGINTRIVRRSNALLGYAYGNDFKYSETMRMGRGMAGLAKASAITAGLAAFGTGIAIPPTRKLMQRFFLPDPGEGPSEETMESGFFEMRLFGRRDGVTSSVASVKLDKDPGYTGTAVMLAESAICLAMDEALKSDGGILTPASAMGEVLIKRLQKAGMTFEIR